MTANAVFVQALADATQRPVEVSPVLEATTLGAAYLAGLATGVWRDEDDIADRWSPRVVVEPRSTARPRPLARRPRPRVELGPRAQRPRLLAAPDLVHFGVVRAWRVDNSELDERRVAHPRGAHVGRPRTLAEHG